MMLTTSQKMAKFKIIPLIKLNANHVKNINQLIGELFGGFDHLLSKDHLNSIIKNPDSKIFGAFHNKLLVGMVLVHIYTSLTRRVTILDELVVDRRFIGQKIGHELIEAAREWAQKNNADCLECTTRLENKTAIRFFQKEGFWDRNQKALRLNLK